MHKPSLAQLVYNATFPRPRTTDPASFSAHITRNLVPEVRIETSTFYGSLDCIEAQYPGLDYSYGPHRMRLGRFPWHRKLFKVFDELGLTEAEISSLCRWEGTKSARERYEKEEGVTVRDTTADNIRIASPTLPPTIHIHSENLAELHNEQEVIMDARGGVVDDLPEEEDVSYHSEHSEEEETSDEEMESYGVELNNRLLVATAAREQGANVSLDEDWEQWLKETVERGGYTDMINAIRSGHPLSLSSTNPSSPRAVSSTTGTAVSSASSVSEPLLFSTPATMAPPIVPQNSALRRSSNHPSGTAR
ncbi:hypothetical protein VTN02DRAFT_1402 [Thermoascus thermophilus]